ncbi:hypothetical protein K4K49_002301 [Colletotrichum sp. SAR 10_70]|nr:hypothetical protein K4K50_003298 [Colletotrichum sp. SAR 10_71]KAI8176790.1 hypothetical protein K4K49_002301 [Colletotrichum sp. SAR 10_70]
MSATRFTEKSTDLYLAGFYKRMRIADLGQLYIDVIYPKVKRAVKTRMDQLASWKDHKINLDGTKDGDRIRL